MSNITKVLGSIKDQAATIPVGKAAKATRRYVGGLVENEQAHQRSLTGLFEAFAAPSVRAEAVLGRAAKTVIADAVTAAVGTRKAAKKTGLHRVTTRKAA